MGRVPDRLELPGPEMTVEDISIRRGDWSDEEGIGALLSVSFANDPFVRWLMPNALDFLHDSRIHARRAYPAAFDARTVFIAGDFMGAAVWLPPGAKVDRSAEPGNAEEESKGEGRPLPPEYPELIRKSASYRPDEPHWHLGLVAVDPAYRGQGLATRLLTHCLEEIDRDGFPVFLESTNAANLTLYERLGFRKLAEVREGFSPARYPMLRPGSNDEG